MQTKEDNKVMGLTITNVHLGVLIALFGLFSQLKSVVIAWSDARAEKQSQIQVVNSLNQASANLQSKIISIETNLLTLQKSLQEQVSALDKSVEEAKGNLKAEISRSYEVDQRVDKDIAEVKTKLPK